MHTQIEQAMVELNGRTFGVVASEEGPGTYVLCMYVCTYVLGSVCVYVCVMYFRKHATAHASYTSAFLHSVSIQDGSSTSLPSGQAASVALPPSLFSQVADTSVGIGFTFYETAALFPLPDDSPDNLTIASAVIGALVAGQSFSNLTDPAIIFLQLTGQVRTLNLCSLVPRSSRL